MCPSPFSGAFIAIQVPKPRSFKSTIGVHCLESMRPLVPADARSRSGIATSGSNVMRPFEDFEALAVQVEETLIFLRRFGSGPADLLLHGFPQADLMWRSVAPLLARRFTVICADLRGYGKSGCPASAPDQASRAGDQHAPAAHANSSPHVATRRPCHVGPSRTNFHSGFLVTSRSAEQTAWN